MHILYNIGVSVYSFTIQVASLFNPKARKWVRGRSGIFRKIEKAISKEGPGKTIWFHCASLGEFEQGRPVMESFRDQNPDWRIILTFFSPSGYEVRKDYEKADHIFYLPADTPDNARKFTGLIKPDAAVFIKYEFWFNYIRCLNKKNIPVVFISAIFRPGQHFFKWYGGWFLSQLHKADRIFVQDKESSKLLHEAGIDKVTVGGDTRFDRVADIRKTAPQNSVAEQFCRGSRVLMAGSTWPEDEALIHEFLEEDPNQLKLVIAPHETGEQRIMQIESLFDGLGTFRLSKAGQYPEEKYRVLIVDSIGHLSALYHYADISYIGGGFGVGIHNILEAATFGKPVIFGTNYHKFREAKELVKLGGAFPVSNAETLVETLRSLINNREKYLQSSGACTKYIDDNTGATRLITSYLDRFNDS